MKTSLVQFSLIISFLILLLTVQSLFAAAAPNDKRPPQCARINCTTPPEGLSCTKTELKNPNLLKKVGNLKDCCAAWRCKEPDGTFSTYFGMSGTEKVAVTSNSSTSSVSDKSKTQPQPKKPPPITTTTTTPAPPPSPPEEPLVQEEEVDACATARAQCPLPDEDDGQGSCVATHSKQAMKFRPVGDLDSCCPIYNCTKNDGTYRLHYLMYGGIVPKKPSEIEKEKGKPSNGNKCPNMVCAPQPSVESDGPVCEKTREADTQRIKNLGKFRDCCDMWMCKYADGSYYTHFEMQSKSFWIAETKFQSEGGNGNENSNGDSEVNGAGVDGDGNGDNNGEDSNNNNNENLSNTDGDSDNSGGGGCCGDAEAGQDDQETASNSGNVVPLPPLGASNFAVQERTSKSEGYTMSFSSFFVNNTKWTKTSGRNVNYDAAQPKAQNENTEDTDGDAGGSGDDSGDNGGRQMVSQVGGGYPGSGMPGMMPMPGAGGFQLGPPPATVPRLPGMQQPSMFMPPMPMMPMFGG